MWYCYHLKGDPPLRLLCAPLNLFLWFDYPPGLQPNWKTLIYLASFPAVETSSSYRILLRWLVITRRLIANLISKLVSHVLQIHYRIFNPFSKVTSWGKKRSALTSNLLRLWDLDPGWEIMRQDSERSSKIKLTLQLSKYLSPETCLCCCTVLPIYIYS